MLHRVLFTFLMNQYHLKCIMRKPTDQLFTGNSSLAMFLSHKIVIYNEQFYPTAWNPLYVRLCAWSDCRLEKPRAHPQETMREKSMVNAQYWDTTLPKQCGGAIVVKVIKIKRSLPSVTCDLWLGSNWILNSKLQTHYPLWPVTRDTSLGSNWIFVSCPIGHWIQKCKLIALYNLWPGTGIQLEIILKSNWMLNSKLQIYYPLWPVTYDLDPIGCVFPV